ncbi:hypothetical protein CK203_056806 [Vitis vinifera]|uniref:Uncharacterized protein n=1 Tax=Vitis vinifera TaxID=29760 RepID=A0A438FVI1_VITVI|nr:hypothetical protein CK203_056806 [Vitis vinifera]
MGFLQQQKTILNKDTTKNIWDSLKQKYQGESVNEYFARSLTIANKMKANGDDKEMLL